MQSYLVQVRIACKTIYIICTTRLLHELGPWNWDPNFRLRLQPSKIAWAPTPQACNTEAMSFPISHMAGFKRKHVERLPWLVTMHLSAGTDFDQTTTCVERAHARWVPLCARGWHTRDHRPIVQLAQPTQSELLSGKRDNVFWIAYSYLLSCLVNTSQNKVFLSFVGQTFFTKIIFVPYINKNYPLYKLHPQNSGFFTPSRSFNFTKSFRSLGDLSSLPQKNYFYKELPCQLIVLLIMAQFLNRTIVAEVGEFCATQTPILSHLRTIWFAGYTSLCRSFPACVKREVALERPATHVFHPSLLAFEAAEQEDLLKMFPFEFSGRK